MADSENHDDFFMAMAFWASLRSKDDRLQVGACLACPHSSNVVGLGYNGMLDDHGFNDESTAWGGAEQSDYACHAELNAIISAYRRGADPSSCILYVTHSPCEHCSKLVTQSEIKKVLYAKIYSENCTEHDMFKTRSFIRVTIDLRNLAFASDISNTEPDRTAATGKRVRREVDLPLDDYFMALAVLVSAGYSLSIRNPGGGACIVMKEPRRAISVGFKRCDNDKVFCAESEAILSAFKYHTDLTNCLLYTTAPPCNKCAQMIVQSGIKIVVYGSRNGIHSMPESTNKIFYWGKIAALEYKEPLTKKTIIEIDLHGLFVRQYGEQNVGGQGDQQGRQKDDQGDQQGWQKDDQGDQHGRQQDYQGDQQGRQKDDQGYQQ